MLTCHRIEDLAGLQQPLHLALGVFDGVHIGHQAVIARAVQAASAHGGLAGLLTFDPHPIRVIAPAKAPAALLATLDHKARIARSLDLGLFVPLHFDLAMAAMEAETFIDQLTAAPVRTIAVGEDWRFGRNRAGDVTLLRQHAERRGFCLEAVPPVMFEGDRISSTRIRQAIRDGNLEAAAAMLGRPYSISGTVIHGRKLGRSLGFPTANITVAEVELPPTGVWAVHAEDHEGIRHPAVANLGTRPTVGGSSLQLEVHLLDFNGDLYGRTLDITFVRHLRPEARFDSVETLRRQISADVADARQCLNLPLLNPA